MSPEHDGGPSGSREKKRAEAEAAEEAKQIGQRLEYRRKTAPLGVPRTLKGMHEATGVAGGTLRAMEDGTGNPGMKTVLKTVKIGYKVRDLQHLLSLPRNELDETDVVVWPGVPTLRQHDTDEVKDNIKYVPVGEVEYYELRPRKKDPQSEVAIARLGPLQSSKRFLRHTHGGDEVILALTGDVTLVRTLANGAEEHTPLKEGQLAVHRGSIMHHAENPSTDNECVYVVVRSPVGLTQVSGHWPPS